MSQNNLHRSENKVVRSPKRLNIFQNSQFIMTSSLACEVTFPLYHLAITLKGNGFILGPKSCAKKV